MKSQYSFWKILGNPGKSWEILGNPGKFWILFSGVIITSCSFLLCLEHIEAIFLMKSQYSFWKILGNPGKSWEILGNPGKFWILFSGVIITSCSFLLCLEHIEAIFL